MTHALEGMREIMNIYRTHNCGELSTSHIGSDIRLAGWVDTIRDHGGVVFVDLRDHYGVTQIVFRDSLMVYGLAREYVISVSGKLRKRDEDTINLKIATGEVEVVADELTVLGASKHQLPFEVRSSINTKEEVRLKYRYLDLRNPMVHGNIILRTKVTSFLRKKMESLGFLEIQTPILTASSPEGARDFLVPSRKNNGMFYALPQAPQQFKQLLMISGFDKYFQIAPCFRDEDARADRSPGEFYQLDFEMSFATQEDVFAVAEEVLHDTFSHFSDKKVSPTPFRRIPFIESMLKYGTDKPDLRNPLIIENLTEFFSDVDFKPFKGKPVRGVVVPNCATAPRSFFENMLNFATGVGMKGLGYISVRANDNTGETEEANGTAESNVGAHEGASADTNVGVNIGVGASVGASADVNVGVGASVGASADANEGASADANVCKESQELIYSFELKGPIVKFLSMDKQKTLIKKLSLKDGDTLFFISDDKKVVDKLAGQIRTELGTRMKLIDESRFEFCFIVDYPMYEINEETGAIDFTHNPFSMPQGEMDALLTKDPLDILAYQYDIVCNGVELSSGAVRNHRPDVMVKAFEIAGYTKSDVESKFPALFNAFQYGAPPHAGMAPGLDRIVMLLAEQENVREVVAFPMNSNAQDLLMGAPAYVTEQQLREAHIKIR